ncbi:MAG: serine hydrolase [Saprospiraceae bacterium]
MRLAILSLLFIFPSFIVFSQELYFPPVTGNTWETVSPGSLGWCEDAIPSLLDYLETNNTKAFIVLKDGKIVIEKYFGSFTRDSVWYWASAGKTLTSFMVGIAQQENLLSISDTSSQYLGQGWTNCTTEQENKITIRHQLTMTTGLDDDLPDNHCTLDTCLLCLADAGTRWAYHNAPYTLLDDVIHSSTGVTLNNYINQKLKIPTGITGAFFASGNDNVFFSKARSMARFGLLILNHGNWNGNQIMTDTAYFHQMVNTSQSLNLSYGYLWWLNGKGSFRLPTLQFLFPGPLMPHAPMDMISALGKNGQIINVVPDQNLVCIRMGDVPGTGEVSIAFNDTIWIKLNNVLCSINATRETFESQLKIFPNPAENNLRIDLIGKIFDFTFIDLLGNILLNRKNNNGSAAFSVSDFARGVYFLNIRTNQGIISRKILLQFD